MAQESIPVSSVPMNKKMWWATTAIPASLLLLVPLRELTGGFASKFGIYNADALSVLIAAWSLASIRRLPIGYRGGISVFDIPAMEVTSGWYLVLLGIAELHMYPVATINSQFPADPEFISKRPDTSPLAENELLPIRIMTAGPKPGIDDILNERMALEFMFSVRWRMGEGEFFELYTAIPGHTWQEKEQEVRKQMRDTAEALLRGEVAKLTPAEINANLTKIGSRIKKLLQAVVSKWGIIIEGVEMQSPDFGSGVNHALAKIPETRATAKNTGIEARATRDRTIQEAEGEAVARERKADARKKELAVEGEGRADAAKALDMDGPAYATLGANAEALGKQSLVLGEAGVAQALGLGKAILESVAKPKEKEDDA